MKPLLVAPDSFKGTFSAGEVAAALARGTAEAGVPAVELPLADGGEGTARVLCRAAAGELLQADVHGPLGEPRRASFALLDGGTRAVLDMAAASGLALLAPERRDPMKADSAGTGELIAAALAAGAREVLVAAGGSASTDGGLGAVHALARAGGLGTAKLTVLCDVTTPFEFAATKFAAQKGANPGQVRELVRRLELVADTLPRDPRGIAMTGCAGGLAGGLWASYDAQLVAGAQFVLDAVGFEAALAASGAVISGEGRLDEQSLEGKLVGELGRRCAARATALYAVVGSSTLDPALAAAAGIGAVIEAPTIRAIADAGRAIAGALASRP